jgi:hypothetical protein
MSKTLTTTTGSVPAVMGRGPAEGTEHLTSDDVHMPRLVLAQAMSPQLNKANPEYVEGLGVGDLFNSVSGLVYGSGPLHFSVLVSHPPRAIEFAPLSDGGGVLDLNVPLTDPRLQFGPNGEHPQATKFYDYVLFLIDSEEVIALSLARSGIKAAKSLNGLIMMRGSAIYTGLYTVESVQATSKEGTYITWKFRNDGTASVAQEAHFHDFHVALKATATPQEPLVPDV